MGNDSAQKRAKTAVRITRRLLDSSATQQGELWDTDLAGFHARVGARSIAFRVAYTTITGKRRVLTLGKYGVLTVEEARRAARETLATVTHGEDPRQVQEHTKEEQLEKAVTLGEYLEGPYTVYQNRKKDGKGALQRIQRDFSVWLTLPMVQLSRVHAEKWQAEEEAKDKPRSFHTLKRSYGALFTMLAHAAGRGIIPSNPLEGVRLQKPAIIGDELINATDRRYLETSEVRALLTGLDLYQDKKRRERRSSRAHGRAYLPSLDDVAYVDHVKPLILTMYYTGFRQGDLFGLRWEHINWRFMVIRKVIEKTAHHNPTPQTFPLSTSAVTVLRSWWEQLEKPSKGYVFSSPVTKGRLDSTSLRKPWLHVKKLGRLDEKLDLYTLRHNFASQLVMAGVDLLSVSKLMSHADVQSTVKYYAHLRPDHMRKAVEAFGNSLALEVANKESSYAATSL